MINMTDCSRPRLTEVGPEDFILTWDEGGGPEIGCPFCYDDLNVNGLNLAEAADKGRAHVATKHPTIIEGEAA